MTVFTAKIISSPSELREFLSSIPPHATLYLDLDSAPSPTHDPPTPDPLTTVSLITILVHQLQQIVILDVLALGYTAFTTLSDAGETLQSLLEDPSYTKYFWDVRGAADALWAHYEVGLDGVVDIQLLENASRRTGRDKEFLAGRDVAIRNDLNPVVGIANVKRDRRPKSAWIPIQLDSGVGGKEGGGTATGVESVDEGKKEEEEVVPVLARPLAEDIVLGCTRGVLHLRGLRDVYMKRISIAWLGKVRQESAKRTEEVYAEGYQPRADVEEEEVKGPWKARLGTVGVTPMMERKDPSLPPYMPAEGLLKVPFKSDEEVEGRQGDVTKMEKKLSKLFGRPVAGVPPFQPFPDMDGGNKVEKKRSRLLRWPGVSASYASFGKDSGSAKVEAVETAAGGWWD